MTRKTMKQVKGASMTWDVGYEQTKPYEYVGIETFENEPDALRFADTFAQARGFIRISKRRWRTHEDSQHLIVRKRWLHGIV